jgi:hypothetical protein
MLVAFGSLWLFSLRMSQGLKETAVLHFANYKVANHASHPDKEKGLTFSYICKGFNWPLSHFSGPAKSANLPVTSIQVMYLLCGVSCIPRLHIMLTKELIFTFHSVDTLW